MKVTSIARLVLVMVGCLLLPAAAWAQALGSGTIAGLVKDTSGGVLPGVTVEAASPALIEKVRTVVTDDQGLYRIVDLRPGTYTVTFTLPGFSMFRRETVELTTSFTATVNAELKVGTLEETVTVSGTTPVVDIQNVLQKTTIAQSTLDAIPTTKRLGNYATLLVGAVSATATAQDVGGTQGEQGSQFAIHGGRPGDLNVYQDGMNQTIGISVAFSYNPHNFQEIVLQTSGNSAESFTGGVLVNIVPKDGGNTVTGSFNTAYAGPRLQQSNLTDALRARGLTATPSVKMSYDVGGSLGGPIKRDTLWFFTAHRWWGAQQYQAGNYYNKTQGTLFYEPDLSRPAHTHDYYRDTSFRLTWQASQKHKVAGSYAIQGNCNCFYQLLNPPGNVLAAPEAVGRHNYQPNYWPLVSWSYPATNRLLFEAGASANNWNINAKRQPEVGPNDLSILELSTNRAYGSRALFSGANSYGTWLLSRQYIQRFAVSYITGSHAFKTGLNLQKAFRGHANGNNFNGIHGARFYTFRNRVPQAVTIFATPYGTRDRTTLVGAYVQDQWTIRKLTLNLGVRYDSVNGSIPEQHLLAGPWVPARDFAAVSNSPNWKNLNPRLGAAYDLFGTGQTALKVFLGRHVPYAPGVLNNPVSAQAPSATRTWTDANGNYVPDCILDAIFPAANGECGPLSDTSFGQVRASNTRYADDALTGFNDSQFYNWQSSVSVQHELRRGVALNVGYFRTWYHNFTATDNQFVTPADYDPFCITAPVDRRLPGGGGNQLCGLYDVRPALFGRIDNLVTQASHYGKQTEVYNGVDVTLNARFGQGGQFSGGLNFGPTVTDNCFVVDSPQQVRPGFCHISKPWSAGTQVKFLVIYPLPWDLQTSATYQNIPGIPITASYAATNAEILPSLGRNLGQCRGAATCNAIATIDLIPPNTLFEDRIQQLDLRFTRNFPMRKVRVRGNFDIYNLFNASPILSMNTRYGPQWLNAVQILGGRLFKFSGQLDF